MARATATKVGGPAPALELPDTEGNVQALPMPGEAPATVVLWTCNHCPYALGWHDRLVQAGRDYAPRGVRFLAVNSNDAERYPDDSLEAMRERVREGGQRHSPTCTTKASGAAIGPPRPRRTSTCSTRIYGSATRALANRPAACAFVRRIATVGRIGTGRRRSVGGVGPGRSAPSAVATIRRHTHLGLDPYRPVDESLSAMA